MSNGADNPLKTADDVRTWCQVHRAESYGAWHHQEGWNGKQEAWMLSLERRIRTLENRGARMIGVAVTIGGAIAALMPYILSKLGG
ncbi:MAG: hypothetical protein O7D91_17535 [Planctomycetota bacterium]|nr:hypothetical protein [Planctomycetota bacterium]